MKIVNEYYRAVDHADRIPKTVWAAIAVSALTCGGDHLEHATPRVLREWWALYENKIVRQRPPGPKPSDEECEEDDA